MPVLRRYIFVIWASLQLVFEVVLEERPFLIVLMDLRNTLWNKYVSQIALSAFFILLTDLLSFQEEI